MANWLESFFNPGRGYEKAGKEMQKYYNQGQSFLNPYMQQGQQQYQTLLQQLQALGDPAKLQGEWAKSYEMSPEAKQATEYARDVGQNEAAAMGLSGSSAALSNIQKGAGDIASQDRSRYMNDLMQKYMASVGIGQGLYNTGAGAAGQLSQNAMNMGQQSGAAQFGKYNAPGGMLGGLLGNIFGLGSAYLGRPQQNNYYG